MPSPSESRAGVYVYVYGSSSPPTAPGGGRDWDSEEAWRTHCPDPRRLPGPVPSGVGEARLETRDSRVGCVDDVDDVDEVQDWGDDRMRHASGPMVTGPRTAGTQYSGPRTCLCYTYSADCSCSFLVRLSGFELGVYGLWFTGHAGVGSRRPGLLLVYVSVYTLKLVPDTIVRVACSVQGVLGSEYVPSASSCLLDFAFWILERWRWGVLGWWDPLSRV